jgi:hypothetical protein
VELGVLSLDVSAKGIVCSFRNPECMLPCFKLDSE